MGSKQKAINIVWIPFMYLSMMIYTVINDVYKFYETIFSHLKTFTELKACTLN